MTNFKELNVFTPEIDAETGYEKFTPVDKGSIVYHNTLCDDMSNIFTLEDVKDIYGTTQEALMEGLVRQVREAEAVQVDHRHDLVDTLAELV